MYLCFRVLRNIYTNVWIPLIYTWKCSVLPKELINPANCQVLQFSWLKIKSMSVNIDWKKCTQFSSNVNLLIVTCLVIPVQNSAVYSEPDEIFACTTLFSFCVNMHMNTCICSVHCHWGSCIPTSGILLFHIIWFDNFSISCFISACDWSLYLCQFDHQRNQWTSKIAGTNRC